MRLLLAAIILTTAIPAMAQDINLNGWKDSGTGVRLHLWPDEAGEAAVRANLTGTGMFGGGGFETMFAVRAWQSRERDDRLVRIISELIAANPWEGWQVLIRWRAVLLVPDEEPFGVFPRPAWRAPALGVIQ